MKIVADEGLADIGALFSDLGDLILLPGREIEPSHVKDADVLLVRSITRVDQALLDGSSIRIVGTATSGIDHIDSNYLNQQNIPLLQAKGSNANAVAEYCIAAIAWYWPKLQSYILAKGSQNQQLCVGIVGGGYTGSALADKLDALGIDFLLCDPPLANAVKAKETNNSQVSYSNLEDISQCAIVSLHVPLIKSGIYKTEKMINKSFIDSLQPNALLINSCRGGVVDEAALLQRLEQGEPLACVMDVWENEPDINLELAQKASLVTPHIAGYSASAKSKATRMIRDALASELGLPMDERSMKPPAAARIECPARVQTAIPWQVLCEALPLQALSEEFRRTVGTDNASAEFDEFRQRIASRLEFSAMRLPVQSLSSSESNQLEGLGFQLG